LNPPRNREQRRRGEEGRGGERTEESFETAQYFGFADISFSRISARLVQEL
jgi:hypothetical protein